MSGAGPAAVAALAHLDPMVPEQAKERRRGGARWCWAEEARVCGAEALGAALLVLLSGAGGGALGAGLTVAALVQCFDHISGAWFNPAVTLAAALWARARWPRAAAAACAQLAGAALGAAVLAALRGPAAGVTRVAAECAPAAAAGLEAAGGAVLALANCAHWDPRNAGLRDSWPLRIGTTVAALTHAAAWCSGGSFNPARSFGPALVARHWDQQWVYWAGPLGGALAATALYRAAWLPAARPAHR